MLKIDKLTFCGDPHLNSSSPASRVDDYRRATLLKLGMIKDRMAVNGSRDLIFLGDMFHRRVQPFAYLVEILKMFQEFGELGITLHSIVGNHDLSYERMESVTSHPLGLLFHTGLLKRLKTLDFETSSGYAVSVRGFDYPEAVLSARDAGCSGSLRICVAHRFYDTGDAFSLSGEEAASLGYHLYILGHDHARYPVIKAGKALVLRPGSLTRGTSHAYQLQRSVAVETVTFRGNRQKPELGWLSDKLDIRPSEEVFSRQVFSRPVSTVFDLSGQVGELIEQMDRTAVDSSIYDYLDALTGVDGRVLERILLYLSRSGLCRPGEAKPA